MATGFAVLLIAGIVVTSWMAVRARRAEQEARAVNDFLQSDLLTQASSYSQATPDTKPDPDLKVRTALDRAAARVAAKFAAQPLVEASIRRTIGGAYIDLSLYSDAEGQFERALAIRQRLLGSKNPDTLASKADMARVFEREGRYGEAEQLCREVTDTSRSVLGAEDPATLRAMLSLAATYGGEAKYDAAESVLSSVLPAVRRVLGEETPETLRAMGNLAAMYPFERQYALAEPLYLKTLALRRRVSGPEHPETLLVLSNLAELCRDEGNYAKSQPLYLEALEAQRRVLASRKLKRSTRRPWKRSAVASERAIRLQPPR